MIISQVSMFLRNFKHVASTTMLRLFENIWKKWTLMLWELKKKGGFMDI